MLLECGTLDDLSIDWFRHEVRVALSCIAEATPEQSEALATSYGLWTAAQAGAFVSAADHAMRACQEACRELRHMVEAINADRAARPAVAGIAVASNRVAATAAIRIGARSPVRASWARSSALPRHRSPSRKSSSSCLSLPHLYRRTRRLHIITNVVVRRVTALVSGCVCLRSSVDTLVTGAGARVEALALDKDGNFLAVRGSNLSNLGGHAAAFVSLQKGSV
jgi:hypothetical protein